MKTLVAYSTKHGATRRYAEALAQYLPAPVTLVDVQKDPGFDVTPFDRVVIGGCIYAGQAQKALKDFCTRNLAVLRGKRVGLFICCWFLDQAERQLQAAFPADLLSLAVAKDAFGGTIDLDKLTFFEKLITKAVAKLEGSVTRYSDESAKAFAQTL